MCIRESQGLTISWYFLKNPQLELCKVTVACNITQKNAVEVKSVLFYYNIWRLYRNMSMSTSLSILEVLVPSDKLMKWAKEFANYDLFATFSKNIKYDSGINFTTLQVMKLITGLNDQLNKVNGMENVGKEVVDAFRPFINIEKNGEDDVMALFQLTPDDIKCLNASDKETKGKMDKNAVQIRQKYAKEGNIDNYNTYFYTMLVLIRFSPKKDTFDFYYAYAYSSNTSIWQWAVSADTKKKRLASLELETIKDLGAAIANNSAGQVVSKSAELEGYKEIFEN